MDQTSPGQQQTEPQVTILNQNNRKKAGLSQIIILAGIAILILLVLLNYFNILPISDLYQKKSSNIPLYTPIPTQQTTPSVQPSSPARNVIPPDQPPWFDDLTSTEKSLFNIPSANTSSEEKQKYSDLILENTKASSELSILKDCRPSPLSLSVDNTLTFKAVNKDTIPHILKISEGGVYSINSGATSIIKLTLDKKPTLLRYSCDSYSVVGFLIAGQ